VAGVFFYSVRDQDCFIAYDALHPPEHPVTDAVLRKRLKERFSLPELGIFETKLENHKNINQGIRPPPPSRDSTMYRWNNSNNC